MNYFIFPLVILSISLVFYVILFVQRFRKRYFPSITGLLAGLFGLLGWIALVVAMAIEKF